MSEHLRVASLYQSPTLTVRDVQCRPHGPECSCEEFSLRHEIVFPRSGLFVKHVRKQDVVADANHVLFFKTGESYRVSHPLPGGDDCTVFEFSPDVLSAASCDYDASVVDRPENVLRQTHVLSSARSVLLQQTIRALAMSYRMGYSHSVDALNVEELAMQLLSEVLKGAYGVRDRARKTARSETVRAHRSHVDATRAVLAKHMHERLTLDEIARAVHCSPFHLTRLFRRETGIPIHKYLNRLRLREAIERLGDGKEDLTELALDLGFTSHSHFSDTFRREFAVTPSRFRHSRNTQTVREMSKKLKA